MLGTQQVFIGRMQKGSMLNGPGGTGSRYLLLSVRFHFYPRQVISQAFDELGRNSVLNKIRRQEVLSHQERENRKPCPLARYFAGKITLCWGHEEENLVCDN